MIQKSQKWYILDQHWWLACFPPFCKFFFWPKEHPNMFFLRIQNVYDLYNSKYSSDMFYDSKFSEMVHSGSALMTDMFSLPSQHPHMFFPYQNPSAKAAFHQNILIVIILIFLLQILCYSYPELPDNVEICFWLFWKKSTLIRGVEDDGWAGHVLDDLLIFGASR